ncbi:MAG: hypothetical protein HKM04_06315 [Legionellales bacterium]|nr:hypothetical protein [Legionellales bacterium]
MSLNDFDKLGMNFFHLIKKRIHLFKLEYKLAKMSIAPLILLAIGLLIVSNTTWLFFLIFITYLIYLHTQHFLICLLAILLLNITFIGILVFFLNKFFINMKFLRTRKHFQKHQPEFNHESDETVKATD